MIRGLYGNIAKTNASSTKQNVNFVFNFKFEKNLIVAFFLLSLLTLMDSKPGIFYGGERNKQTKFFFLIICRGIILKVFFIIYNNLHFEFS